MTHHPAAFINNIREEGTKEEACDHLQQVWNELRSLTPLEGRTSLLAMVARSGLSDAEICRRAGLGVNTISNLRTYPKRSLMWPTVRALVEAMGYRIYVR